MRVGGHAGQWEDESCRHDYAYICEFGEFGRKWRH